jgi:hypothetical protein
MVQSCVLQQRKRQMLFHCAHQESSHLSSINITSLPSNKKALPDSDIEDDDNVDTDGE